MSKDSDERYTPQSVLNLVREFDVIGLDPCTTEDNPVRATRWFTKEYDGLTHAWATPHASERGVVFVNPPYSRGELLRWSFKITTEWAQNDVESIVLVPSDTSTKSFQLLLELCSAVAFWKKRIVFRGTDGAKFANAFFYFGDRQGRFKRLFSPYASVVVLR